MWHRIDADGASRDDANEDGSTVDEEDRNVSSLGDHAASLQQYFQSKFEESVVRFEGNLSLLHEWKVEIFKAAGGLGVGIIDVHYCGSNGKKHRSRVEAMMSLGIIPHARNVRSMSKSLLYDLANEVRAKLLITQQLHLLSTYGECTSVVEEGSEIVLLFNNDVSPIEPIMKSPSIKPCYGVGNVTVLNWGKIIPDPAFHSTTQIYPIGFRCLRQEHDVLFDRLVDCLCEIDSCKDGSTLGGTVCPLFRIVVSWATDLGQLFIRVYEAKTPQLAWQAAMLESLGVEEAVPTTDLIGIDKPESEDIGMDYEEKALRREMRDTRRDYFRALRSEQSLGLQGAVKPRLAIDSVDGFADEMVLRMIEGMPGSDSCEAYQFLDSRVKEGGRKHFHRCLSRANMMNKSNDRILKKSASKDVLREEKENKKRKHNETIEEKERVKREREQMRVEKAAKAASQRQRLRDLDKAVKTMRDNLSKDVKRFRLDARLRVEGMCELEENGLRVKSSTSLPSPDAPDKTRAPRPQPSMHVPLRGDSFGDVLELWGFLISFSEALGLQMVPDLTTLSDCFRFSDLFMRSLSRKAMCFAHAFDTVVSRHVQYDVFEDAATEMKRASAMIDKIGVALVRPLMPEFFKLMGVEADNQPSAAYMLNSMTWLEIVRVVVLGSLTKEVGFVDADVVAAIKGRAFTMVPDASDRRVLRLCKRRILNNYQYINENHEAIFGFSTGFCIRIPYAYCDSYCPDFTWKELIDVLESTPDCCEWKIEETIKLAILALGVVSLPDKDVRKSSLKALLEPDVIRANDAGEAKRIALAEFRDLSEKLDIAEDRAMQYMRASELLSLNTLRMKLSNNTSLSFATPLYTSSEALGFLHKLESVELKDDLLEDVEEGAEVVRSAKEDVSKILKALSSHAQIDFSIEVEKIENLSVASQRCFTILRDVMVLPIAGPFNQPVDVMTNLEYYRRIKYPLALSDIRRWLVNGRYEGELHLTRFYLDVNLVLENALVFNSETSSIGQAAVKVWFIFERLFLESVLYWENPLHRNDLCNSCRSDEQIVASKSMVCDRCDATYHSSCLDQNNHRASEKKYEWFCPGCVEQQCIAVTHHYRSAIVTHPSTKCEGEVVGIDQVNMKLQFTILFKDSSRELWLSSKIKENFARINSSSGEASGEVDTKEIPFPSGYSEEDIDTVSGICRGYQSWGSLQLLTPPHISDAHSFAAEKSKAINSHFSRWQRVVGLLGPIQSPDNLNAMDWLEILLTLVRKNLSSPSSLLAPAIASLDVDTSVSSINPIGSKLTDIGLKPQVSIGNDLLFMDDAFHEVEAEEPVRESALVETANGPTIGDIDGMLEESDTASHGASSVNDDSSDDLFSNTSASAMEVADDDLFDENFNPDDGMMEVTTEHENSYEIKREARAKGREDALLTKHLVSEIVGSTDLSDEDFGENEDNMKSSEYNFRNSVFQTAVRASTPRHSEVRDNVEWHRSWESKLMSLLDKASSEVLCQFCGYHESYLGSQFVCGFTWSEWLEYDQKHSSTYSSEPSFWLPYNQSDAQFELQAAARVGTKEFKRGSVVVHECCADNMHSLRKAALRKATNNDDDAIAEQINGLKRGRRNPIGVDSEGSVYWVFPGCAWLFVSTSATSSLYGYSAESSILNEICVSGRDSIGLDTHSSDSSSSCKLTADAAPCRWLIYSQAHDVARVIGWLGDTPFNEKMLKRVLQTLFPEAADLTNALTNGHDHSMEISASSNEPVVDTTAFSGTLSSRNFASPSVDYNIQNMSTASSAVEGQVRSLDEDFSAVANEEERSVGVSVDSEELDESVWVRPQRRRIEPVKTDDPPKFKVTENVLVFCTRGELIREARVYEMRKESGYYFYNVKFIGAPRPHVLNCWFREDSVHSISPVNIAQQRINSVRYTRENVTLPPPVLRNLNALRFTRSSDRAGAGIGRCREVITYSETSNILSILKAGLLTIEAALPIGSVDESDDRWGEGFDEAWRNAIVSASTPSAIMECQLSLEHALKSAWIKPIGTKMLTSLPSRAYSTKYATYSMVALRLWSLDQALKYEKVVLPSTESTNSSSKVTAKSKGRK